MLKTCSQDNNYALINIKDILSELVSKDSERKDELLRIYQSSEFDENGDYHFKKDSKLYHYLKDRSNIINGDTYISFDQLARAFIIANYEHNYEIEKKLKKYCRYFIDSYIHQKNQDIVINMILDDEKVVNYITRFQSIDEFIKYEQEKIKGKTKGKIVSVSQEKSVPKSFVKIG